MTPQQRQEIARYLEAFDFSGLFSDPSVGWDWPDSGSRLGVPFEGGFLELESVAEKRGVRVLLVPPKIDGTIIPSDARKKLEKAVTPLAAEHLLIFTDARKTRQVWLWTSRLPGKPVRHRELTWEKGRTNELLLQKLSSIAFTLDEEDALDITGVVQRLRDNLDRDRLTKRFYDDFKNHKDAFQKFIKGIADGGVLAHYTSLMLNRLMFCYFLQQKGFLNGEQDYLRRRLDTVRETLGENRFHSFYRSFLKRLFYEGFDGEERPPELTALIGPNIPYLNGGIFAEHPIERAHPDIQIPDDAFEKVFQFFDAWEWHLDARPLAEGNEINPEVLGYVFEKYTNQKEMGAYYTKEDITEYISKNTILPFLLQKVADKLPDSAWDLLKENPDHYIYEPVRRGASDSPGEWEASLPENIRPGLRPPKLQEVVTSERPIQTLELRRDWNNPSPPSHGLPTEIWRETISRHQRCHDLRRKLRAGEVRAPSDLITLNLDIRQFVQDVIAAAPADLALALWRNLRSLSVLDPTCGSGAFLFAALEILQPLYEGLLERFRALLTDWQSSGEKHPNWEKEITQILDAVARHPNEDYFIHKTIIVHNLYGVDIMEEAVEICKLRLFLKLAAQLEPGQQIEPLPDIDFNVRAGNTLVGYASREEIKRAFTEAAGSGQTLLQGIENSLDDYTRIMEQAEDADRAFRRFQDLQDDFGQSAEDFRSAKHTLEGALASLRDQLDRFLAGQYHQKHLKTDAAFKKWQASHQPFHWFTEFYGIMNGGGVDVIVGNPPYIELKEIKSYGLRGYACADAGNLYAVSMERCASLGSANGRQGFIVPVSSVSTDRYESLQSLLVKREDWFSSFDDRPSRLFDGLEHIRLTIHLIGRPSNQSCLMSTRYNKWSAEQRPELFTCLEYSPSTARIVKQTLPKLACSLEAHIIRKLSGERSALPMYYSKTAPHSIYYSRKVGYFLQVLDFQPRVLDGRGNRRPPSEFKALNFQDSRHSVFALCILNSNLFYWFVTVFSDCRHINKREVDAIPVDLNRLADGSTSIQLAALAPRLMTDLDANSTDRVMKFKHDVLTVQCIFPKPSKPIIDQIDMLLAEHYRFTEEELDFIINYDIKYRMGLGSGSARSDV